MMFSKWNKKVNIYIEMICWLSEREMYYKSMQSAMPVNHFKLWNVSLTRVYLDGGGGG